MACIVAVRHFQLQLPTSVAVAVMFWTCYVEVWIASLSVAGSRRCLTAMYPYAHASLLRMLSADVTHGTCMLPLPRQLAGASSVATIPA